MEIEKLKETLATAFPGSTPELEVVEGVGRIGGFLIWSGFDDMDQLSRQRALSGALRDRLDREQLLGVTTILTLTPDEVAVMRS